MDLEHAAGLHVGTSKRGDGGRRGRRFIRAAAQVEKEHRALTMLVKGMTQKEIAANLGMSEGGVSMLIKRALELRAAAMGETVEQARVLLLTRYEVLVQRLWPWATGDYVDPDQEEGGNPPSLPAIDRLLKVLQAIGEVSGAMRPAPAPVQQLNVGGVHVHSSQPAELDALRAGILADLSAARAKGQVIQGELAKAKTSLEDYETGRADDRPGPPPRKGEAA